MAMYRPDRADDDADLRFKIFRWSETLSLSQILPHLSLLGVDVVDERPYELAVGRRQAGLRLRLRRRRARAVAQTVEKRWDAAARDQFMDAFAASYGGRSEPDRFNALVMGADLGWRQVEHPARRRSLSASDRVDLLPDLRRPGAERQRGDRPAAGRAVRRRSSTPSSTSARPIGPRRSRISGTRSSWRWTRWPASTTTRSSAPTWRSSTPSSGPASTSPDGRRSRSSCCPARSPTCRSRGPRTRSSSTRRGSRASTCGSARWPAAGCAGRTGPRTSGPRSSVWSRRRWSRTP